MQQSATHVSWQYIIFGMNRKDQKTHNGFTIKKYLYIYLSHTNSNKMKLKSLPVSSIGRNIVIHFSVWRAWR